ncbi:hypothetical protein [Rubinisphaera margarita]|uniref:hypothetical protein n=1 Tax=Rubinisphaera margarita TaxID=2909586 RepID=UPI001EE946F6|nr:hypothetical protein [Rubinisphaera margarita]MCG6154625.1 hypothetical protein [Rubinisphaera margarita]
MLRIGEVRKVTPPLGSKAIAHTHTSGLLILSDADIRVITKQEQHETFIIAPDGAMVLWRRTGKEAVNLDDVDGGLSAFAHEIVHKGERND